ncbi:MAG: putative ankyrin repeat-containing protein [Gammaproteobacteria bacterium]|nr:putative ankyrin repeat-containing protein [Gammaproteobacteria bacterium]
MHEPTSLAAPTSNVEPPPKSSQEILNEELREAVHSCRPQAVESLLKAGANPNILKERDIEALIFSTNLHATSTLTFLLKSEKINREALDGTLSSTVTRNRLDLAEVLLKAGANPNLPEIFHFAISLKGNIDLLRLFLNYGADPNQISEYFGKETPLYAAVRQGRLTMVQLLLAHKATPKPQHSPSLLLEAAKFKNSKMLDLLSEVAEPNEASLNEALQEAVHSRAPEAIAFLLRTGAGPSILTIHDISFLITDGGPHSLSILVTLLESRKIDLNVLNQALLLALNHHRLDIVRLFVQAGANPVQLGTVEEMKNSSPLFIAANELFIAKQTPNAAHIEEEQTGVIFRLLAGANFNEIDLSNIELDGKALLSWGLRHKQSAETIFNFYQRGIISQRALDDLLLAYSRWDEAPEDDVAFLLRAGANPNRLPDYNNSLLQAVGAQNIKVIRALLRHGRIDQGILNKALQQITHIDARRPNFNDVVEILLAAGANPNLLRPSADNPLLQAVSTQNIKVMQALLTHSRGKIAQAILNKALQQTAHIDVDHPNFNDVIKLLLAAGANPNVPEDDRTNLLLQSIQSLDIKMVLALLTHGRGKISQAILNRALSILFFEFSHINFQIADLLVNHGADLEWKNQKGDTLLSMAMHDGNLTATQYLLKHGADPRVMIGPKGEIRAICKKTFERLGKSILALLFDHAFIETYRNQPKNDGQFISFEEKQTLIKNISQISFFAWGKDKKEIVTLLLKKISECANALELPMLATATKKIFNETKVEIPEEIIPILAQLSEYEAITIDADCDDEDRYAVANAENIPEDEKQDDINQSQQLWLAIRHGDIANARRLLMLGVNPNVKDQDDKPLLRSLVQQDVEWGVKLLFAYGAHPNELEPMDGATQSWIHDKLGKTLDELGFEYGVIEKYRELCMPSVGQILDWTQPHDTLLQALEGKTLKISIQALTKLTELTAPTASSHFPFFKKNEPNSFNTWLHKNIGNFDNALKLEALANFMKDKFQPNAIQDELSSILEKLKSPMEVMAVKSLNG